MKTLLSFVPNPTDATSFYRAVGPFQHLRKKMDFQFLQGVDVNWATLKNCDAIFMQRAFTQGHVKVVDMAKDNGKKIWVDYDDDLFSVPKSNRAFKLYDNPQHQNNVAQILGKADVVTVSTEILRKKFVDILDLVAKGAPDVEDLILDPEKIKVIPNAFDEEFVDHYRKGNRKQPKQNKLISWRGSDTHDKDLIVHTPAIKSAIANHLDWTFNFVGSPFWMTIEELQTIPGIKPQTVIESEPVDPAQYWKMLWLTCPALVMAPLWDCPFNRAKSNIAWIEAIHAGAACLAPDWEEWKRPGIINYTDHKDFGDKLDRFMRGEFDGDALYNQGMEYLRDNLTLSIVNQRREAILKELWG